MCQSEKSLFQFMHKALNGHFIELLYMVDGGCILLKKIVMTIIADGSKEITVSVVFHQK